MANATFAETLDNSQHSEQFNSESRSYSLNSSCENLRTRIGNDMEGSGRGLIERIIGTQKALSWGLTVFYSVFVLKDPQSLQILTS
jgi:hypothetical protein